MHSQPSSLFLEECGPSHRSADDLHWSQRVLHFGSRAAAQESIHGTDERRSDKESDRQADNRVNILDLLVTIGTEQCRESW
jgi:hypothetical protein